MNQRRLILVVLIGLLAVAAGGAATLFARDSGSWEDILVRLGLMDPPAPGVNASGFIEAEEIDIGPQLGGRIAELLVEKGDYVTVDTHLARLDGSLLEAQIESARAAVGIAEARLAQLEAGARPERIRQAEADLEYAIAARDGAYDGWQDAAAMRDNPQELNVEIAGARFAVQAAEAELAAAAALKDAAVVAHDQYWDAKERWPEVRERLEEEYQEYLDAIDEWEEAKRRLEEKHEDFWDCPELESLRRELEEWYDRIVEAKLPEVPEEMPTQLSFDMIPYEYWRAWVGVHTASTKLEQARVHLRNLLAMQDNPQALRARADAARAEYEQARAVVEQAEAQVAGLRLGPTGEEIAVARAQVARDEASLNRLETERDKQILTAPVGGLVLQLSARQGELANPGVTLLTLGNLDEVLLTVYVSADRLGHVDVGQKAEIVVDSFPAEVFAGEVVAIADQAEFIPRNIQVREERVKMVFAVDIAVPNPHHRLKPGMPADATLLPEDS